MRPSCLWLAPFLATRLLSAAAPVSFESAGHTEIGDWSATVTLKGDAWKPGASIDVTATLRLPASLEQGLADLKIAADGYCLLITAERTFDSDGWLRLPSDERMSTLVAPTGLAIEGGVQGAITNRFGAYDFRTPLDVFLTRPIGQTAWVDGKRLVYFNTTQTLPADLPPGIYRLRLDFGASVKTRYYSLTGETFAYRTGTKTPLTESHVYTPPLRASGTHASGKPVDAASIQPRLPWTLLASYNSNGYYGTVADEDKPRFALSNRSILPDDVVLPLYDTANRVLSYSLEPQFPTDTIEPRSNIPWDYTKGELSIQVTGPDGKTTDLGTAPFVAQKGQWPTTNQSAMTAWKPSAYGYYTVRMTGWTADIWGNRYQGGGTYHFWIANRLTVATATFQAMSYPVGNRYGRDLAFNPAVPAQVEMTATLYRDSDPSRPETLTCSGTASPAGLFTAAQGMKPLTFSGPGEYRGHVLAKYTDAKGNLWIGVMTHAGVVYDPATPIVARGKKLTVGTQYVERGETKREGYITDAGEQHLEHINFPFNSGDVLLIASEGQGANKIEPVLTWDNKDKPLAYDSGLQTIGRSNLKLKTSNGLSPHMFPEYITDWQYFYGGAPRPGFMGRVLVAENGSRAPYWPTSPNSFGGQIAASSNGDLPGDIYRLIGGVVLRNKGQAPLYAGYLANAFLLPKGSNNNRIIAAGSEDVQGPYNRKGRVFLVGTRPGLVYETGTVFTPPVQIDPVLPVTVTITLDTPDGRSLLTSGPGDATGTFVGERWTLDAPGIYRYRVSADWNGYKGVMPGLPPEGGFLYVVEKDRPANAPQLGLNLPVTSTLNPALGLTFEGSSTAATVAYAAIMPGAVLDQGVITVNKGKFAFHWSPKLMNEQSPTYDIANRVSGAPAIGDVVHLTFFSEEKAADGKTWRSFARLILRGNQVIWTR